MLWWAIGVWLGSAAIIPVLWLLSIVCPNLFSPNVAAEQKQAASEPSNTVAAASIVHPSHSVDWLAAWGIRLPSRQANGRLGRHMGRYALGGLATVGALILLYVGSSSGSITTVPDLTSSSAVARALGTQLAVGNLASAMLKPSGAQVSKPVEDDIDTGHEVVPHERSASGEAEQVTSIEVPTSDGIANGASPQPDAVEPPAPAPVRPRNRARARARRLSALAHDIRSSHGTWLWAPNPNGGGNS